ncbi:hypothetical protein [Priestia taiwanensis]|uniref:Uncharacterized protein n=1 Tax=Priestia taiwanensis TaxID=1347902 RepID=A0A917ERA7_9BACI|nr:hypothetical protein [Priestia taiwanensis]MBM7363887.1 cellulose synthase/poly-beta-1,6-N-acetylglucosamine synthase-like glycosyltransferase [Priestia taiwanensis]GGE69840.1 hypothetical protein GCM10007140_19800 [Priestia taiwanensis]
MVWILLFFLLVGLTLVIVWTGGSDSHYKSPYSFYWDRQQIDSEEEEENHQEKD